MSEINVNLKPCRCVGPRDERKTHWDGCAGAPVVILCPIPHTVEFEVALGECACPPRNFDVMRNYDGHVSPTCPARPIRVTCSIGGDGTWAGSEVTEVENKIENVRHWGMS